MLSILHRITGVALSVGTLVLVYWLISIASGPESFSVAQEHLTSWYGRLALIGWTFSFYYHLCNGIRHLAWDLGYGFEIDDLTRSGWFVLIITVVLTLSTFAIAYYKVIL
jgi:succinate dehydrogenase / fumarate reductase cytochrome b subunit